MFGIGGFELFLILLFAFLIFGPDKLPEIAKTVGKGIAKFRSAQEDMTDQLKNVAFIDKDSDTPFKNPLSVVEEAARNASDKAGAAADVADKLSDAAVERSDSFAERKARYDRERAAKREAAQRESEAAAKAEEDALKQAEAQRENPVMDVGKKTLSEEED